MLTRMFVRKLFFCLLTVFAPISLADFSVQSDTWPDQANTNSNYYGNGQTERFRKTQSGDHGQLTEQERAEINAMIPERQTSRWYGRLGMNVSTLKIDDLKNKSTSTSGIGLKLTDKKKVKDIKGIELAGGYVWTNWRVEGEYLYKKKIEHNTTPLFTSNIGASGSGNMKSDITGHTLLANLYYEFKDMYIFKPFVGVSAGFSQNTVKTKLTTFGVAPTIADNAEKSTSKLGIAWGVTLGARVGFWSKFYAQAGYRYVSLGGLKWVDSKSLINLESKYILSGFSLSLIYLF